MSDMQGQFRGWRAVLGCTYESLAAFRICLGMLLTLELVLRFRFLLPFYSNEGTLPLDLLMGKVDSLYKHVCFHCYFGEVWEQQILLSVQIILSVLLTLGYRTNFVAPVSWFWYLSLTLRNTWMNYILDRYIHYLLFLSMFLPLDERWSLRGATPKKEKGNVVLSPGTIFLKLLVVWIYVDAGVGKYMDPLGGWTYHADPLPALDTYARHTTVARYMYALLGPEGLRVMTPTVVWVELLAAPVALFGLLVGSTSLIYFAVISICSLHVGIALTLRNAALLSFLACTPWCTFLPLTSSMSGASFQISRPATGKVRNTASLVFILSMLAGNLWLETVSQACDQSVKHIWSTVFHNRWNVFVGAEEYVTWEIAPGQLVDGSVVDVWGRTNSISWDLPGSGAPCTATSRPGRWRSFPYLAGLENEDGDALWSYLCREWDRENDADLHPERKLVKFNFFMLQADVLPNMQFSPTRKRLIQSFECATAEVQQEKAIEEGDGGRREEAPSLSDSEL